MRWFGAEMGERARPRYPTEVKRLPRDALCSRRFTAGTNVAKI
jgi:hypothetical protein